MENNKHIEHLKKFFIISNAAFAFADAISGVLGNNKSMVSCKMRLLHQEALKELEKESPDMEMIDKLLSEMEEQATSNKRESLIKDMIKKMKDINYGPPYCIISRKEFDLLNFPEITKIQIDPDVSDDYIFLYPCNGEITRSNAGLYHLTYVPKA